MGDSTPREGASKASKSSDTLRSVKGESTVLSHRYYLQICLLALGLFLVGLIWIGLNRISDHPYCSIISPRAPWARDWNVFIGGGLCVTLCLQCNRIFLSNFRQENTLGTLSTYYATLCVNVICTITHFCVLLFDWGGVCRDAFGVEFPVALLIEWIVTVPFLVFITVSVHDKPYLSRDDLLVVISQLLMMILCFLSSLTSSSLIRGISIAVCAMLALPFFHFTYRAQIELQELLQKSHENLAKRGTLERKVLLASRKTTLATTLATLMPLFPLVYFFSSYQFLDASFTHVAFLFSSAFTKVFFASVCMDAHLEVSHPVIALIDAEKFAHTTRRAFLRYVLHEVRVPLNSISLGIQILSNNHNMNDDDRETISLMKEAVNFMGETLNDVMALQTVEEGTLELLHKPFSIKDLFQNIEDSFNDIANDLEIQLKTIIDNNVPRVVIGDKYRLRHVLANIVSNAIKYSFANNNVIIRASARNVSSLDLSLESIQKNGKFMMIIFSVEDHGRGISKEDQEDDIFQPYRALKHGELKEGRGTGLGLSICKEIVHMHGGEISYRSELGKGTTFFVHIPLEIGEEENVLTWNTSHRTKSLGGLKGTLDSHYKILYPPTATTSSSLNDQSTDPIKRNPHREDSGYSTTGQFIDLSPLSQGKKSLQFQQISKSNSRSKSNEELVIRLPSTSTFSSNRLEESLHGAVPLEPPTPIPETPKTPFIMECKLDDVVRTNDSNSALTSISNVKVLVVDDVQSNRKFLTQILKIKGLKVIDMAEDGAVAVQKVEAGFIQDPNKQPYDIIFMDNTMPEMNGIEATQRLRSMGFNNLIIGVTANCMEDELLDFSNSGADLVITKPMKQTILELLLQLMKLDGSKSQPNKRLKYRENSLIWEPWPKF